MSTTLVENLRKHASRLEPNWVTLRRRLHANPELSGEEFATTAELAARVGKLMEVKRRKDGPGFWADRLFGGPVGGDSSRLSRLALRADIDALPIQTELTTPYASVNANCMHACGHDVHATILCATIDLLDCLDRERLLPCPISLRAIFQPAEEISEGAAALIAEGVLEQVDRIFALHVDSSRPVGLIGTRVGPFTASCDVFEVHFHGTGGHSARPHLTSDLPAAVAHWITQLHARLPRSIDPFEPTVASIGTIQCGDASNIIPTKATLRGTLRSTHRSAHDAAWLLMHRLSRATGELFDCQVEARSIRMSPGVVNDGGCNRIINASATAIIGADHIQSILHPSMGAEDFAFYLEKIPGAMFRLGVAGEHTGSQPLHTPRFDIDERAISLGAQIMAAVAITHAQGTAEFTS